MVFTLNGPGRYPGAVSFCGVLYRRFASFDASAISACITPA